MNPGNLIWKHEGWFLNGTDKVRVGDVLEVEQPNGSWKQIRVGKDAQEVFLPEPRGEPFNTGMHVRRVHT